MNELLKVLDTDGATSEVRVMSIMGPAGVGKTCLAVEIGHHLTDSDVTVCYIDTSFVSLDSLPDYIFHSTAGPHNQHKNGNSTERLLHWLSQENAQPLVIILDNCDSLLATEGIRLQQFLRVLLENTAVSVKFVITSRRKIPFSEQVFEYQLKEIGFDDSCKLLCSVSERHLSLADCELITKITRGIPLSLMLIGGILKSTNMGVSSVISGLQKEMESQESRLGFQTSLDACIRLSLRHFKRNFTDLGKYLSLFPASFSHSDACAVLSFLTNKDCAWIGKLRQASLLQLTSNNRYLLRERVKRHFVRLREESRVRESDFWRNYLRHFSQVLQSWSLQFQKNHRHVTEIDKLDKKEIQHFLRIHIDCCTEFPSLCLKGLHAIRVSIESQSIALFYSEDSVVHLLQSSLANIEHIAESTELTANRGDVIDLYSYFALSLINLRPTEGEFVSVQAENWLDQYTDSSNSLLLRDFYSNLSVHYRRVGKLQEELYCHIKLLKSVGRLSECDLNTCSYSQVSETYFSMGEHRLSAIFQELHIEHSNLTTLQLTEALLRFHSCQVMGNISKAETIARKILHLSTGLVRDESKQSHRQLEVYNNISAVFRLHKWNNEAEQVEEGLLAIVRDADFTQVKKEAVHRVLFSLIDTLIVAKEYRTVPKVVECLLNTYSTEEKAKERNRIAALHLVLGTAELYNQRRRASINSLRVVTDLYFQDAKLFNYARNACNAMLIQTHIELTCFDVAFREALIVVHSICDFITSNTFDTDSFSFYHIYEFPILVPGALQVDNIAQVPVGPYCIVFFLKWCLANILYIFSFRFIVQVINIALILLKCALVLSVPVFCFFLLYGTINFTKRVYRVLWIPVWSDDCL